MQVQAERMIWNNHTLSCPLPECGADDGWTLHAEVSRAWASCAAGHEVVHPLVYPAWVQRADELVRRGWPLYQQAEAGPWSPHWRDEHGVYRDWLDERAPDRAWWAARWPALVKAHEKVQRAYEMAQNSASDHAGWWWLNFGDNDPDLKVIKLVGVPPYRH